MSDNKHKSKKQKRGKKRNATNLLSTNNTKNNTQNPRPSKRHRINDTIQSLLQMSESQIQTLPQALKQHAIEIRKSRNKNVNINNNKINHQIQLSEISDTDSNNSDSNSESENEPHIPVNPVIQPQNNKRKYTAAAPQIQPKPRAQYQNNNRHNYNQNINTIPLHLTGHTNNSMQYNRKPKSKPRYVYIPQQNIPGARINSDISQPVICDRKNDNNCNFGFFGCLIIICMILSLMPVLQLIKNNVSINYCDDSKFGIGYNSNCIECPKHAVYCELGVAYCPMEHVVDIDINECVKNTGLFKEKVVKIYKNILNNFILLIGNGWNELIGYCNGQMEWIGKLSFEEFCKWFEMEIMVVFFMLVWRRSVFRLVVIFCCQRMIMPIVNGGEDNMIVIGLNLLSYFVVVTLFYEIRNKIGGLFGK